MVVWWGLGGEGKLVCVGWVELVRGVYIWGRWVGWKEIWVACCVFVLKGGYDIKRWFCFLGIGMENGRG